MGSFSQRFAIHSCSYSLLYVHMVVMTCVAHEVESRMDLHLRLQPRSGASMCTTVLVPILIKAPLQ